MKAKVTVYIVSHNYGAFLRDAIESVLRQSMDDWELLIIDAASQDETADVLRTYQGSPRVSCYTLESSDLRVAANFAIQKSEGEYIVRLDADDFFDENILLVLSNQLDRRPDCAVVFPDYYLVNQAGEIVRHERIEKQTDENCLSDTPPNGACTMFRVSVLEDVGGYREDLNAQDGFDVWSRIKKHHKVLNVNLPLFYYRRHQFNMTNDTHRILTARRTIQRDECVPLLDSHRPLTVIIPCRQHYDFIENLWASQIGGQNLLEICIRMALSSDLVDQVVVASDTELVLDTVKKIADSKVTFFKRSPKETINSLSFSKTFEDIVSQKKLKSAGVSTIAYLNTPFKTVETLEESVFTLLINQVDASIGVEQMEQPIYGRTAYGLQPLNRKGAVTSDFHRVYSETNTFLTSRNKNGLEGRLFGPRVGSYVVPKRESFRIDSPEGLAIAQMLYQEKLSRDD